MQTSTFSKKSIHLASLEDTKKVALSVIQSAKNIAIVKPCIIYLNGDLGSGKTTFCQYFINQLFSSTINIVSPTFNLLNIYDSYDVKVCHMDLYRIKTTSEIEYLGIQQYFEINHIWLVEWASKANSVIPNPSISLDFLLTYKQGNLQRHVKISS